MSLCTKQRHWPEGSTSLFCAIFRHLCDLYLRATDLLGASLCKTGLTFVTSGFVPERPRKIRGAAGGAVHGPRQSDQAHGTDRVPQVRPHPHVRDSDQGKATQGQKPKRGRAELQCLPQQRLVTQGKGDVPPTPCPFSACAVK